jgi:hypothetical protein
MTQKFVHEIVWYEDMSQIIVIPDEHKKFAQMVNELYIAYKKKMKFKFEANFSGNPEDFKHFYANMDPQALYAVVTESMSKESEIYQIKGA